MSQLRTTVYQYFQTGDIPTEAQFQFSWNSVWFKDEKFTISDTTGLENALQNKLDTTHLTDENAHQNTLAKLNASNLNDEQKEAWKSALGVGTIPDNIAFVDAGVVPEVYNKDQIHAMTMLIADYTIAGKVRADKIEALGLTDLIQVDENTLTDFVANADNYEFQKNDFVAIPDVNGNYSLFIFKGGNKNVVGSYLATGLTNITISMVEGLQTALNGKVDKPISQGSYFAQIDQNGSYIWRNIVPTANNLLVWNGSAFEASNWFRNPANGRIGVGTTTPTEQLHLMARARMSALVLDENTEILPGQITRSGNRFSGTNPSGIKKGFQYNDYEDFLSTFSGFSQAQNLTISQLLNGGAGSGGNMSVNLISPPIVQNQYDSIEYIMLQGANLNLSAVSRKVEILEADKTTVKAIIPDNQVQTYDNGLSLVFYYNFHQFTEGQYFIRLTSGSKVFITSLDLNIVPQITNVNLNNLTWDIIYDQSITPNSNDIAIGDNFRITLPDMDTVLPVINLKSSEIFDVGEDFYIEFKIQLSAYGSNASNASKTFIGIGYSSTQNSNINNTLASTSYYTTNRTYNYGNGDTYLANAQSAPLEYNVKIIKTGNLFRTIIGNLNKSDILTNNEGYSFFANLIAYTTQNGIFPGQNVIVQCKILKAFKFN